MPKNKMELLTKNWGYKLIALVFAVVVWVYVFSNPETTRDKIIKDVPITFTGEAAMNSERGLVLTGSGESQQKTATVTVSVNTGNFSNVRSDNVRAVVDLSGVTEAGTHTLRVNTSVPSYAKVTNITPSVMSVTADELAARTIPVTPQYLGSVAEGYWNGAVELNPSSISVSGPLSEIEQISKAVCYIPLDGVTSSYNDSLRVSLLNTGGQIVQTGNFLSDIPSVIVKMPVLPKKTVPLDIDSALKGADNIASGYEVRSVQANPAAVEIAAPQEILDGIDRLTVDSVNLNNARESIISVSSIRKPNSAVILLTYDATEIYVVVSEMQDMNIYEEMTVDVKNTVKGLSYTLSKPAANLVIEGTLTELEAVDAANREIYVDVQGITDEGIYTLPITFDKPDGARGVSANISPSHISVEVTKK